MIYTKVDIDTYEEIFPQWGTEMGLMLKALEEVSGESLWGSSGDSSVKPLLVEDLGLTIGKDLETWETAMERMDWKTRFGL